MKLRDEIAELRRRTQGPLFPVLQALLDFTEAAIMALQEAEIADSLQNVADIAKSVLDKLEEEI